MTKPLNISDHELVAKARTGDRLAQKFLYQRFSGPLYNTSLRMLKNQPEAEDVLQESFIQAFKNLDKFKGESALGSWLHRITINKCLECIRKRRYQYFSIDEQWKELTDEAEEEIPDMKVVNEEIKKLPNGCREIFCLYLLEGYQHDEIAHHLNINISTSKTQYRRAKMMLRERLKNFRESSL